MNNKKVLVFDLDGTLTVSKFPLSSEMASILCRLLEKYLVAVVSGGSFSQFQKQFLPYLSCDGDRLRNLSLFPTMGTTCYTYNKDINEWDKIYSESLSERDRTKITDAFKELINEVKLDTTHSYGDIIEDRGGNQITFSALGQEAPIEKKEVWDPDQIKRRKFVKILGEKIPEYEITIGGATSIDVTKKGIDKAYTIGRIKKLLNVMDDDIIFVGDALYKGGNDAPIKKTGVDYVQERGPLETMEFLRNYL